VKIPFKDASLLVQRRAVFLHKGMAFVPMKEFYSIASAHFRTRLAQEMISAYRNIAQIMKDPRISYMLLNLSNPNSIDFNIYEPKAPTDTDKINL
jgi:DNA primase large subunit